MSQEGEEIQQRHCVYEQTIAGIWPFCSNPSLYIFKRLESFEPDLNSSTYYLLVQHL